MTLVADFKRRVAQYERAHHGKRPKQIALEPQKWLDLVIEMALLHPGATPESAKFLRKYGYQGHVFIGGVEAVTDG